jgi:hypothetical protein
LISDDPRLRTCCQGSSFARMPTHAMKLHEWGTRGMAGVMYGPPATQSDLLPEYLKLWGSRRFDGLQFAISAGFFEFLS